LDEIVLHRAILPAKPHLESAPQTKLQQGFPCRNGWGEQMCFDAATVTKIKISPGTTICSTSSVRQCNKSPGKIVMIWKLPALNNNLPL
jgi:hypothetical protein